MGFRFRVWMPLVAVFIVLLTVATLLLYVLPAVKSRLGEYVEDRTLVRAVAAANAVEEAEGEAVQEQLDLASRAGGGQVVVIDRAGQELRSAGPKVLSPLPEDIAEAAADGRRLNEEIRGARVAVVPLVRDGTLEGGVVFVAGASEASVYEILLRSGIEAAAVASILGGGIALLLATLLSRRVENLTAGARSIERGDLSHRLRVGFHDELGELANSFNAMALKLENSFARLEEHGETLNTILHNLDEGVVATDLHGRVVFVNASARRMLGLEDGDALIHSPGPWADFDLRRAIERCAGRSECHEARVNDGDDLYSVNLEYLPEFDDHEGAVLVVIQDLSEGRRLEANQQRFLANAAHELRTPITTILGASELLLTEQRDDPEVRRRFLEHIFAEAQRMHRLSDTLLRLARTGADLREPQTEAVELGEIAREAVERMEPIARSGGVALRVRGDGGRVSADREWLEQCLLILIGNALQHAGGSGEVRVVPGAEAVAVEDDGVGIPEDDLPYVFERFYRSGNGSEGFGLGLPICKELVERMGGAIDLRSEEGLGTRVEIRLRAEEGPRDGARRV